MAAVIAGPRSCYRADGKPKVAFHSSHAVRQYAKNTRAILGGHKTRHYHCPTCGLYHTASR